MARTTEDVYNSILAVKANIPILGTLLLNTSQVQIFRAIDWSLAEIISGMYQLWDIQLADMKEVRNTSTACTPQWWNYKMKYHFQYDITDTKKGVLSIQSDLLPPTYETIDETKRIIKYCSTKRVASKQQKVVKVKVAKRVNGLPAQLTQDELSASISYAQSICGAGDAIDVVSFPSDLIKGVITIIFNGMYVQSVIKDNVMNAITSYFQNLDFEGKVLIMDLVNYIEKVEGVENILINELYGTPEGGVSKLFSTIEQRNEYETQAGYVKIDEPNFTINMILN